MGKQTKGRKAEQPAEEETILDSRRTYTETNDPKIKSMFEISIKVPISNYVKFSSAVVTESTKYKRNVM